MHSSEDLKKAPSRRLLLIVGGLTYEVEAHLLQKYPDSFLAKMLNPEWKEASESVLSIERDGPAFKFVYDLLSFGMLPRNQYGYTLLDRSQLEAVQAEAEFYQLPNLVKECQDLLSTSNLRQLIKNCAYVYAQTARRAHKYNGKVQFSPEKIGGEIFQAWKGINAPPWLQGSLPQNGEQHTVIYNLTTVEKVNLKELMAAAKPSPYGRGSETVMDTSVRDSLEIPASDLNDLS